jgi:hypothetical protein
MSEQTKAALERALTEHIADETTGGIITDWAAVIAVTDFEDIGTGRTRYWCEGGTNQPIHVTAGLLHYGRETVTFSGDDDE